MTKVPEIIPISDLHSGEQRKVVLRIRVVAEKIGGIDLGKIDLSFKPTGKSELARATVNWRAEVTDNPELVLANRDGEAARYIERALTAKAINDATTMYEQGRQHDAVRLLERRKAAAMKVAKDLGDNALGAEVNKAADFAEGNFAQAPAQPSSNAGKRAQKLNREDAYQLAK